MQLRARLFRAGAKNFVHACAKRSRARNRPSYNSNSINQCCVFMRYRRSSRYRSMSFSIVFPWLCGFIFCTVDLYFVVAERSKAICCFQFIFYTIGKTLISITIALKAYRTKNIFSVSHNINP